MRDAPTLFDFPIRDPLLLFGAVRCAAPYSFPFPAAAFRFSQYAFIR